MSLSIKQLHPLFAAEVSGIKLSPSLSDAQAAELHDAINQYAILIFHDQHFDDDELLDTGKRFGSIAPPRNHRSGDRLKHAVLADISNLDQNGELRKRDDTRRLDGLANQLWHSDASFRPISGELSMLYAHVVPPEGGDTQFADLRAAYDALDDDLRTIIADHWAEHSILHSRGLLGYSDYNEAERSLVPEVRHPVVRTHPGSKRQSLYLGSHASHIIDLPIPDGRLLLRELMEHATQQQFVHTHSWRKGDLVIWDNRCTLHRGKRYDDIKYKRDLRRVTTQDLTTVDHNPELVPAS
ncbi:MAG: alpha-ketoglutarate-dependent 2,4-dichlorophenoxyacetate dioxygenase [Hyphomicrobiaceae bacterium]